MIVAVGPVADVPSWRWVGLHAIKELSAHFQVEVFNSFDVLPGASVILVVKKLPPLGFMELARTNKKKVVYIPIDQFESDSGIIANSPVLKLCSAILSHAESLIPLFKSFAPTYLLEHPGIYHLSEIKDYQKSGHILWVGGFQFVPYLLHWVTHHAPLPAKLVLCTDFKCKSAITRANNLARELNVSLRLLRNFEVQEWSEPVQKQLMETAKAAIDIKWNDFGQYHKPPTKGQKYIASGIPFAINPGNNCYNYFKGRGFPICSPEEHNRWLSEEYWRATAAFARQLRKATSSESVGLALRHCVNALMTNTDPSKLVGLMVNSL